MITDVHAHVTVDVNAHLERARLGGVERTVLLSTRTHPEACRTLGELKAESARLRAVIGGAHQPLEDYRRAMAELTNALDATAGRTLGFAQVPLGLDVDQTGTWLDGYLSRPDLVGIGELTPAPDQAHLVEPVLAASTDHGGLPVLVHGFSPNTRGDLRTYAALAARYPNVPVIVGAFGGLFAMDLIDLALERPNLYLDLSSALQVFVIRAAVDALPTRCLFGSNTPYGDVVAAVHTIEAAVCDPDARARVLGGNAASLLDR